MAAVPAIIVTGFLGSGKTTFLNELGPRLRAAGKRVAVLVNEMGAVNVDRLLVAESDYAFELNQGSIFCACVQNDLLKVLQQVTRLAPDVLVIEATGVSDPADIGGLGGPSPSAKLCRPVLVVCLAAADRFYKIAQTLASARRQAALAQLIIITGSDRCAAADLEATKQAIARLNPHAVVVEAAHARLPEQVWDMVLAAASTGWPQPISPAQASTEELFGPVERARSLYTTQLLQVAPLASFAEVDGVIAQLPPGTERAKGFVTVAGQPYVLHLANGQIQWQPAPSGVTEGGYLVVVKRR